MIKIINVKNVHNTVKHVIIQNTNVHLVLKLLFIMKKRINVFVIQDAMVVIMMEHVQTVNQDIHIILILKCVIFAK